MRSETDANIRASIFERKGEILSGLYLGNTVAEHDDLLDECYIETKQCQDLILDRVDLMPGTKGSGKSAIYRWLVDYVAPRIYHASHMVLIGGVDISDEAVFKYFLSDFAAFSEDEFGAFWKLYFLHLLSSRWIMNSSMASDLAPARKEIGEFKRLCRELEFPPLGGDNMLRSMLQSTLTYFKNRKISFKHNWNNPALGTTELEITPSGNMCTDSRRSKPKRHSIAILDLDPLFQAAIAIMRKSGYYVWIMMDQLDIVFPQRSETEKRALRSLLRVGNQLGRKGVRVKVFLRDDIFEFITDTQEGFVGLTHIMARKAGTLRWESAEMALFIVRRLLHNTILQEELGFVKPSDISDTRSAEHCIRLTFPDRLNNQTPINWIMNYLADGRQIITPRDVLDLLSHATTFELKNWRDGKREASLFSARALWRAWEEVSKTKRDGTLYGEYANFREEIAKFEGKKHRYTLSELQDLLGQQNATTIKHLLSIGLLEKRHRKPEDVFVVPRIYRPSLSIVGGWHRHSQTI